MAAITSSSPPHLSATNPPVTDSRNILHEAVPRPLITTGSVLTMYPQASSPLRAYPEPIPSESQMPGDPSYFTTEQRPQQQSLSQEDQNLANSLSHDMNGQMSALSPQMSNGQAQNFGITGQGGMPPTPQQPPGAPPMAGQHSGVDPNQELSYGVGSDRRKRSKVSRACDECRRKKVRCDSTTSDGNIIEKCSNCRRLKTTCQFERAPMKRGPSKGYIKELAERVQQVESQMGIPTGYRASVDAASPSDTYPEQSYSPTEPMSGSRKRTFSQFDGRNPFAQSPQSSRDRMASLGGYNIHHGAQGGRGSFAIAPDQQLVDISPTAGAPTADLAKPFWAQETDVEHPRTKKADEAKPSVDDVWKGDSLFSVYLDLVHNDISILPKSFETVQYHVSRCPQQLASAFTHVLGVICGCKPSDVAYVSVTELEDYAWANARILPTNREFSENIVWLWVYAFMLINADTDIARLRGIGSQLSKQTILKLAIDLGQYFLSDVRHGEPEETHDGIHSTRSLVQRTWSCINIYAQLHAIGTGTEDWISTDNSKRLSPQPDIRSLLSESTAFLADLSTILSLLSSHISSTDFSGPSSLLVVKTRRIVESFVDIMISTIPSTTASSSLVQEAQLFVSLLLARHTFVNDPSEILDLALKLADNLHTDPVNPQDHEPPVVRVLDAHIYTLTGLTLMELIDSEDADLVKASQNGLAKLRHALEQVSERTDSRLQQSLTDGRSSTTPQLHWADALLRVIIAKGETGQGQHRSSEATLEAVDPTIQSHNDQDHIPVEGSTDAKDNNTNDIQVISAHQQYLISRLAKVATIQNTIRTSGTTMTMIDFSLLTRTGYLNVLADLNGF